MKRKVALRGRNHLMEAGVPIPVIQRLMGHKSISTTLKYLHVSAGYVGTLTSPMELLRMPDIAGGQGADRGPH